MSIYKGTTLLSGVATNTITNAHDLFDWKWTDHELNDQSWLNANTFSWQDGTVYSNAYSHLTADYSGGTSKMETIGSHTITFVEAADGHRITTDESTVADIYTESGVAWFYVLDTTNQRFKLPRSTHGEIVEKHHSGTNWYRVWSDGWCEQGGSVVTTSTNPCPVTLLKQYATTDYTVWTSHIDSAGNQNNYRCIKEKTTAGFSFWTWQTSGITTFWVACGYISSTPNNTPYQKLYFYVGQFSQSATEQTAGLNAELFNGKLDLDFNNMNPSATAKETIVGWCMPDYSTGISISLTNNVELEWTAPYNCFVRVSGSGSSGSAPGIARIRTKDDVDIVRVDIATSSVSCVGTFVAVGEKVKLYARSNNVGGIYYALKGN